MVFICWGGEGGGVARESCFAFLILMDGSKPQNISQHQQVCFWLTARTVHPRHACHEFIEFLAF